MANFTFQANRCGTQECGAISVNCLTPCPSISAIIIVKNDYSGGWVVGALRRTADEYLGFILASLGLRP